MNLTKEDQISLLKLARQTLENCFNSEKETNVKSFENNKKFTEKKGTFVTLTQNKNLRGCIGHIIPLQELYKDVIDNAVAAGFEDPRFPHLEAGELDSVKIEISVLDMPKKLEFKDSDDLIKKLEKTKPGVILKYHSNKATFLPQVWDEIKDANEFLTHLCAKAGLPPNIWQHKKVTIETYDVLKFSE
jgi:uncharacterized protein